MKSPKKKVEMGDPSPLVSVILPFYNAPHLNEAIESMLCQTYTDFELLLINNGSTDTSVEVAQSFTNHPKVRLVKETAKGVVHAFNTGFSISQGKYIARMDADDIAHPDRLKHQVNYLNSHTEVGIVSGLVEYLGSTSNKGFIHYVEWINSIRSFEQIRANQFVEFPLANPTLMFRRELFTAYGSYQEGNFPEDYEFFLRLISKGVRWEKVSQDILKWRDSPNRLTRTDQRYAHEAFFRIKAKYLADWLKMHNPFHPYIYIWGAGRLSRRRSDLLIDLGIKVVSYIDLKEGKNIINYKEVPSRDNAFIVSYVANRGAREEIRVFLEQRDYREEVHFILAS